MADVGPIVNSSDIPETGGIRHHQRKQHDRLVVVYTADHLEGVLLQKPGVTVGGGYAGKFDGAGDLNDILFAGFGSFKFTALSSGRP